MREKDKSLVVLSTDVKVLKGLTRRTQEEGAWFSNPHFCCMRCGWENQRVHRRSFLRNITRSVTISTVGNRAEHDSSCTIGLRRVREAIATGPGLGHPVAQDRRGARGSRAQGLRGGGEKQPIIIADFVLVLLGPIQRCCAMCTAIY